MKGITRLMAGILTLLFCLATLSACMPELDRKTKEGATVGAVAGGVLGVLFDKHNRWRGALLGAALGAVIGGTAANIMDRASKDAAYYRKPVTYESEDKVQRVYAQPVKSEGNCEWVKVQYFEYGKLVKEENKRVCN